MTPVSSGRVILVDLVVGQGLRISKSIVFNEFARLFRILYKLDPATKLLIRQWSYVVPILWGHRPYDRYAIKVLSGTNVFNFLLLSISS